MTLSRRINYAWRVLMVGVAFVYFGLGGLFLSLILLPLFALMIRDKQKCRRITQRTISLSFQGLLKMVRALGLIDYRFENLARFEEDYGCVVVANHPTLLDYVFLASCMPSCDSIVKEALLHNIFVRGVIKAAGYISNGDADHFINSCQRLLDNDGMLLIFPEGTRSKKNQPLKLQRGAANIALRTKSDLRIVSIFCDHPLLTKELKWYKLPVLKSTFIIKVEEKINIHSYLNGESLTLSARALTGDLTRKFNHNLTNIAEKHHEFTKRD